MQLNYKIKLNNKLKITFFPRGHLIYVAKVLLYDIVELASPRLTLLTFSIYSLGESVDALILILMSFVHFSTLYRI